MNTISHLLELASMRGGKDLDRDFEVLLCHCIGKSRAWLYSHSEFSVGSVESELFLDLVCQRISGIPTAYLVGKREFWSLDLEVNRYTLIPRHETELLVEWALSLDLPINAKVLDLGTGSGAIALALASEQPKWEIHATDFSEEALIVAKKNSARLGLNQLSFSRSYWYESLSESHYWDLIISNPPYIDWDNFNDESSLSFEPQLALRAEDRGLSELRKIIIGAPKYLKNSGFLILEHGYDQRILVTSELELAEFLEIESRVDMSGLDRATGGRTNA